MPRRKHSTKSEDSLYHRGEGGVIGAVIYNPSLYHKVYWLTPDNFHFGINVGLWGLIQETVREGLDIDKMTLLGRDKHLRDTYIDELVANKVPERNLTSNAKVILEMWRLREMGTVSASISDGLENGAVLNPRGFLSKVKDDFTSIYATQTKESGTNAQDVLQASMDMMRAKDQSLMTPWSSLDRMVTIRPSDIVVIGARPSIGKTSLACQWMIDLARRGVGCAFFSLETSKSLLGKRLITIEAQTRVDEDTLEDVVSHINKMKTYPFYVYDSVYNIDDIISAIGLLCTTHNVKVVFIDYLQLVESNYTRDVANTAHVVGKISRQFKISAQINGITIVLMSQLNRNLEHRPDKRPCLSDLRDSGCIEQDASHVWLMCEKDDDIEIIIAKQKDGPTGSIRLQFNRSLYRFETTSDVSTVRA